MGNGSSEVLHCAHPVLLHSVALRSRLVIGIALAQKSECNIPMLSASVTAREYTLRRSRALANRKCARFGSRFLRSALHLHFCDVDPSRRSLRLRARDQLAAGQHAGWIRPRDSMGLPRMATPRYVRLSRRLSTGSWRRPASPNETHAERTSLAGGLAVAAQLLGR